LSREASTDSDLWQVYDRSLKGAKYIDLTHTITPSIPVWMRSNFYMSNAIFSFMAMSRSTPTPPQLSRVKNGCCTTAIPKPKA
jgi:hypothetical protein